LAPNGNCYHCYFEKKYPECNLFCVSALEKQIKMEGTGNVAAKALEIINDSITEVEKEYGY
jgi:hypothetical protein